MEMDDEVEVVNEFFWSLVVEPGKQYTQDLPYNLHINHVSLGEDAKPGSKSVLYCETEDGSKHPIVTLREGKVEQMSLNLFFPSDETLRLRSSDTSAKIHLLGFCDEVEDEVGSDEEDESEEEDDEPPQLVVADQVVDAGNKRKAAVEEAPPAKKAKVDDANKKRPTSASTPALHAPKKEEPAPQKVEPAPKKAETPKKKAESPKKAETPQKKAESPKKETQKKEEKKEEKKKEEKKEGGVGVSKKLAMGVMSTVTQIGKGAVARDGKKVSVQYRGVLDKGGKQFDAGKISFRLGLGEVIKGWDIGVSGMQVGEKRTLVIPAPAAYGKRGAPPDIPPNATLRFEVTLLNVQ